MDKFVEIENAPNFLSVAISSKYPWESLDSLESGINEKTVIASALIDFTQQNNKNKYIYMYIKID